jgi:hypothetical protein
MFTPPLKGNIMFKALRLSGIAAVIAIATLSASGAQAAASPRSEYGMAGSAAGAERHITINGDTKWVNVDNGDTVEFTANGKSFTWHFDTLHAEEAFDLAKIAPAGVAAGKVTVYVASNPLYRS